MDKLVIPPPCKQAITAIFIILRGISSSSTSKCILASSIKRNQLMHEITCQSVSLVPTEHSTPMESDGICTNLLTEEPLKVIIMAFEL